ncbi:MAG: glutaredoxin domain-containing protein [Nanobdellota archaeon]
MTMNLIRIQKILLVAILLFTTITIASAQEDSKVTVYFFWGDGCPHCGDEKPFLEEMDAKYSGLNVKMFETWNKPENADLFRKAAQEYGTTARGVPATFIGEEYWVGYSDSIGQKMENHIQKCLDQGCEDPLADLINKDNANSDAGTTSEKTSKSESSEELCLHFFMKKGCPQCSNVEDFLKSIEKKHNIGLNKYNINSEPDKEIYNSFKKNYGLTTGAYPIIFIGDKYLVGESSIKNNLEEEIVYCKENQCTCPLEKIDGMTPYLPKSKDITSEKQEMVSIPLVGTVNLSVMPITVTTAIISFIDGFNPCSLWLITFLLGIVIYSNSRKKILTVGGTFLLVTGIAYALFMAGLLNVFLYIGYLKIIQIIVATIAFIFAIVNIKDYFWYKKGVSFTIPDKYKPKIFRNMREIMKSDKSLAATVIGTGFLALGVVLVELPCTAGFPLVWSNMIAQNQIQGFAFFMLLLLYMVIYLSIEIMIILVALITMKATRFEEKQGRILKLVGGMIMLALAIVMLLKPDLMNNISTTILIFGSAIGFAFLLIWIHRRILPKYGIKIGTEKLEGDKNE